MRKCLGMLFALCLASDASAQGIGVGVGLDDILTHPGGGVLGPALDFNFSTGNFRQAGAPGCVSVTTCVTVTRTTTNGSATNLLPTSLLGQTITSFGNNVIRPAVAGGVIVEEARANNLLNATAPITQTTASIDCSGSCTLWVNGTGSATPSAGTATGCSGFAAATQGVPNTFTCVAGTIIVTVAGSLNAFQLEIGGFGTSLCTSGASACSRTGDVITATIVPSIGAAYSIFVSGTPAAPLTTANNQSFLQVSDGTNTNRSAIIRGSAGGGGGATPVGTAGALSNAAFNGTLGGPVLPTGSLSKGAASYTGATTVFSAINVGSRPDGLLQLDGTIAHIAIWPTTALTGPVLQAITSGSNP